MSNVEAMKMVQISYVDSQGERVVLGNLHSFIEAARAITDHSEILELQHGEAMFMGLAAPIVTEFEDGTVLRYSLKNVDAPDTD